MKSRINVGTRTFFLSTPETDTEFERIVELNTAVHGQGVGEICRLIDASYPGMCRTDWYTVTDPDSGRALSTLCRIPTVWTFRGCRAEVHLPAAELSIVATAEDSRGLGLSSLLARHYEKESLARGFTISTIEGIPYYYRRFGYEYAAPLCIQLRLGPGLMPRPGNEHDSWRPGKELIPPESRPVDFAGIKLRCAGPADRAVLARLYDASMAGFSVCGKREAGVWDYLLGPGAKGAETGLRRLIASIGGRDVGYLGLGVDGFGPGYAIIEAAIDSALPETTRRRVAGAFLAEAERERESRGAAHLVISVPRSNEVSALALEYGADDRWDYGWQVKVIDPLGFLRTIAPVVEARLAESNWRGQPYSLSVGLFGRTLRIDWDGARLVVAEGAPGQESSGAGAAESCSIPPELLSPLVLGYRSIAEIRSLRHDLSVYGDAENFLAAAEHQALLAYLLASESRFVAATVNGDARDYRASLVLHHFPEYAALLEARVREQLPALCRFFDIPLFEPSRIECQLNAHNDGHFYKIHNDNGSSATAQRLLTCVYYLHQQPCAFSGGALRLYDSRVENNHYIAADSWRDIEPRDNSAVFFLSRCLHEVRPVVSANPHFSTSRFAVTVWVSA